MYLLTWNTSIAAAMPANSAAVVPRFAISSRSITAAAVRTPYRSRIKAESPLPVTIPRRAPISWVTRSATPAISVSHRSSYPNLAPTIEYVVIPCASLSAEAAINPGPRTARNATSVLRRKRPRDRPRAPCARRGQGRGRRSSLTGGTRGRLGA